MDELIGKQVSAEEVGVFYKQYPGFWFLLEVLETDSGGKARKMRVARYDKSKDELREHLFEGDINANSRYIFVYAGPDGKCELE